MCLTREEQNYLRKIQYKFYFIGKIILDHNQEKKCKKRAFKTLWKGILVVIVYLYYYISLFVSFVNIAMTLGNLFQRIASICDRF